MIFVNLLTLTYLFLFINFYTLYIPRWRAAKSRFAHPNRMHMENGRRSQEAKYLSRLRPIYRLAQKKSNKFERLGYGRVFSPP